MKLLAGTTIPEEIEQLKWLVEQYHIAESSIAFLTGAEERNQQATYRLSDAFLKFSEYLRNFGVAAVEAGETIRQNIVAPFIEIQQTFDEWIPPDIDLSTVENFGDAILSLQSTIVASLERSALTFRNFANDVIQAFRRIMLANYTRKFLKMMTNLATGGTSGFFAGVAKVLGFQQGGPVTAMGGGGGGSRDVIPAMLSPGERVIPAGQPASAAASVSESNITVNVYPSAMTIGEADSWGHHIK